MISGFSKQYTDHLLHDKDTSSARSAVIQALGELSWVIATTDSCVIAAKTPFNLITRGEDVHIDLTLEGTIHATSRSRRPVIGLDCGKNRKNIEALFSTMEKWL